MHTIHTTEQFDTWFSGLKDRLAKARIQARIDRLEDGNLGDWKPIREGVSELRVDVGAGYRVYFKQIGLELVILLAGGNKSTQDKDIKTALAIAKALKG